MSEIKEGLICPYPGTEFFCKIFCVGNAVKKQCFKRIFGVSASKSDICAGKAAMILLVEKTLKRFCFYNATQSCYHCTVRILLYQKC